MSGVQKRQAKQADKIFDQAIGFEDVSKSSKKYKILKVGYGKKNPNVNSFWKKKKGKKK